jgi:chemotaxis protein methyltransferase WspC
MKRLDDISMLLQQRIGLNSQSLGGRGVERAVQRRMAQRKLAQAEQYWIELQESEIEFARLVDEVVVPESWFFRDGKPFQILVEHASRYRQTGDRAKPLRVLSAPCAAGEEPYSIAMTLLEGGLRPTDFTIDAVDISEKLLAAARRMIYRPASCRGAEAAFQPHFFERTDAGEIRVAPAVQSSVHFFPGNLVDPGFGKSLQPYAVIFCRNLLIYLEERARHRVLETMDRLLAPGGLLVVGHAEAGCVSRAGFEPAKSSGSFAFCKTGSHSLPGQPARSTAVIPVQIKPTDPRLPTRDAGPRGGSNLPVFNPGESWSINRPNSGSGHVEIPGATAELELQEVQNLADSGKLRQAAVLCAHYIKGHRACPRGLYLLGMVRMAEARKREAEELFNQVVYLDPHHREAMIHLAHLAEARGEQAVARRWRQRAERIPERPVVL